MRVFASVFLAVSSALAYEVTYPNDTEGWNTTGPNYLTWVRVGTDPLNFTAVLTNDQTNYNEVVGSAVDGTLNIVRCSPPSGGWPSGSAFRVNLAQDSENLNTILAQSSEFNITDVSSTQSTTSTQSATSTATASGVSSSNTSTTPTGTGAASLGADAQSGLLTAVTALVALIATLY